jgi:uncharacterized protein HemX
MVEERITETTDAAGNVTERVIERGTERSGEPTIINTAPASTGGGGSGLIIIVLLLALVVGGFFYFTQSTQNRKDEAVAEAADNVGAAAKKVGDSVEKAADKLVN